MRQFSFLSPVLFGFSLLLLKCGDDAPGTSLVTEQDLCATTYAGMCGVACGSDAECAAGLHCGANGSCTAQCGPSVACAQGQTCTEAGRCASGGMSGGSGGSIGLDIDGSVGSGGEDSSSGGGSGDACASIDIELGTVIPTVVLLIDQSGSMEDSDLEPGLDRWQALKQALRDADGPVATLESTVRFGMVFYSNDLQLDEPPMDGVCPALDRGGDDNALMPPALGRFQAFADYFEPLGTFRNTPTAESFERVAAELAAFAEPGPKYIVLATDGDPDRCENNREGDSNPQTGGALSRQMVVDAVTAAYAEDITTYVISVGDDVAETHLNDVANAGQGFAVDDPTDRFYKVTNQDALTEAFQSVINGVRDCTLTLNGEIDPDLAGRGQVLLDGEAIPMGDSNGWKVIDGQTIELVGAACDAIEDGSHSLSARFPCEVVIRPPVQ